MLGNIVQDAVAQVPVSNGGCTGSQVDVCAGPCLRGALIYTRSMDETSAIYNRIAPDHLEVGSRDLHRWERLLKHAGANVLGPIAAELAYGHWLQDHALTAHMRLPRWSGPVSRRVATRLR
jgi:histidinol dehydrogenase